MVPGDASTCKLNSDLTGTLFVRRRYGIFYPIGWRADISGRSTTQSSCAGCSFPRGARQFRNGNCSRARAWQVFSPLS